MLLARDPEFVFTTIRGGGMPLRRRLLAASFLMMGLSGCAFPDVSAWLNGKGEDAAQTPPATQVAVKPVPAGWIVDDTTNCATSNPNPTPNETIRWFGDCQDGRLHGEGTLIWYLNGRETERNEGNFRNGELHGEVVTTFADGTYIVGPYKQGARNGSFMVQLADGSHTQAHYEDGRLTARRVASDEEVDNWLRARAAQVAGGGSETDVVQMAENPVRVEGPLSPVAVTTRQDQRSETAREPMNRQTAMTVPPAPALPVPSMPALPKTSVAEAPAAAAPAPLPTSMAPVSSPTERPQSVAAVYRPGTDTIIVSSREVTTGQGYYLPAPIASAFNPVSGYQTTARPARWQPPMPPAPSDSDHGAIRAAMMFAGQDGPWIIDSRNPDGRPATQVQFRAAAMQPTAAPIPVNVPAAPAARNLSADQLFSQGYQLELAGAHDSAARVYDELLLAYPSAPAALLANARLVNLRQPQLVTAPYDQNATAVTAVQGTASQVVTVNAPSPGGSLRPASLSAGRQSASPALHRRVCTRRGLYEAESGWCGTVTSEQDGDFWVRIDNVHLRGFAMIGITRSACTGNTFLTWFSRGASVRVPRECMTFM
jgi:hypothetical protein